MHFTHAKCRAFCPVVQAARQVTRSTGQPVEATCNTYYIHQKLLPAGHLRCQEHATAAPAFCSLIVVPRVTLDPDCRGL